MKKEVVTTAKKRRAIFVAFKLAKMFHLKFRGDALTFSVRCQLSLLTFIYCVIANAVTHSLGLVVRL